MKDQMRSKLGMRTERIINRYVNCRLLFPHFDLTYVVFAPLKRHRNYSANFNNHIHLSMEFHENSSKWNQIILCERRDREMNEWTGMTNLVTTYPSLVQHA